jgi:hypothetical protein
MLAAVLGDAHSAFALDGRIIDATSGRPVQDAYVISAGVRGLGNKVGAFRLAKASDVLFARAPGYRAASVTAADLARSAGVIKLTPLTPKALYLTVYGVGSKSLREGAMALIRNGSANALVIDVKGDRGIVPYPSAQAQAVNPGARKVTTIPDLAAFVRRMHAQGVYLIARIVVFKDDPFAAARPDLAVKRGCSGTGKTWPGPIRFRRGCERTTSGWRWRRLERGSTRSSSITSASRIRRLGFDWPNPRI